MNTELRTKNKYLGFAGEKKGENIYLSNFVAPRNISPPGKGLTTLSSL
jgi:hypothetical protein